MGTWSGSADKSVLLMPLCIIRTVIISRLPLEPVSDRALKALTSQWQQEYM